MACSQAMPASRWQRDMWSPVTEERADRVLRFAAVVALAEQQVEGLEDRRPAILDVREVVHIGQTADLAEAGRSVALDPEPVRMPM
jgi:hypothetical protein